MRKDNKGKLNSITRSRDEPKIKRFFSGKRFPLAALSSIDDQMFFLGPSLLDGRLLFPEPALKPELLFDVDIAS